MEEENAPVFTYFDIRGRGEITRLMIAAAKLNIKEVRVNTTNNEWAELKPTMPFRQLPILNISGHVFAQSLAIQKFIAIKAGLYPKHPLAQLMTDQIANAREDLFIAESRVALAEDVLTRNSANATLQNAYPIYLEQFNNFIEQNPAKSGFVIGHKLSLADIIIFEGVYSVSKMSPEMLDNYPAIKVLAHKVAAAEGILQYLVNRPEMPI